MIPETFEMLRDGETGNQNLSLGVLARTGAITAYGPVADAYKVLGEIAAASGLWGDDRIFLGITMLQRCRYGLDKGVLEAFRLHWKDSYHPLRQSIEAAGAVDLIRRRPNLVKPWLAAGKNDTAYTTFLDTFPTAEILPRTDTLTAELRKWYGRSARLGHSSIYGFVQRLVITDRDPQNRRTTGFGYFDGADKKDALETAAQVVAHYRNHLQVHLLIQRVFARALEPALQHDRATWDAAHAAASDALDAVLARLDAGVSLPIAQGQQAVIQLRK
jgi:hypothetical protein